jgi:peptidyl-prolyl cis-trans isomerase C
MPIFVNEIEIEDHTVFSEMQYHSGETMEQARDAAAQALVVRELLHQEATKQGISRSGDAEEALDAALMELIENEVAVPSATADFCKTYYEQNKERFRTSDASNAFLPFELVEDKIRDYLHTRSIREGIRSYVLNLAGNARISGFDLAGSL